MTKSAMTTVSRVKDRKLWDAVDFIMGDAQEEDAASSLRQQIEESGLTIDYRLEDGCRVVTITGSGGDCLKFTTWTDPKIQEGNKMLRELETILGRSFGTRVYDLKYSLSYTNAKFYRRVETFLKLALSDSLYYRKS